MLPEPLPLPLHDQRSADILARVRVAFAEKGFDGASMQDLARAAGMSVGNFYRYFPSKAAIVEGLIGRDLMQVEADFTFVISAPHPMEALRQALHIRVPAHQCNNDGPLWAEITAAAQHKPEIGAACLQMETTIVRLLCSVFAAETGLSQAEAQARFAPEAEFIMLLVKSSATITLTDAARTQALNALILETIDRTLDRISSPSPKA